MAKNRPQVSPPAPFEQINEMYETPDVQAFRSYSPDTKLLSAALDAQFENARRNITDSYGAYSGIPSQVLRNRMRDEALRDLEESKALALAEGNERTQAMKFAQLEALANLTKKTRSSGYNTSVTQPQSGNTIGSLLSGGASVASAAAAIA